jgi:prepilin-type N-terminal cleavage/methylation domain-containing protein
MPDLLQCRRNALRRASGFTLLEVLFVIAILSVIALIAVPDPAASEVHRLELAAVKVADAIRQARDAARRQGQTMEVAVEGASVLQVYRVDDASVPPARLENLRDPLSRQPLAIDLAAAQSTRRVTVSSALLFDNVGTRSSVFLSTEGLPFYLNSAGDRHRLLNGTVTLTLDAHVSSVHIDTLTGRITIQ